MTPKEQYLTIVQRLLDGNSLLISLLSKMNAENFKEYFPKVENEINKTNQIIKSLSYVSDSDSIN